VTADHGNADIMYDIETGTPHTAHTLNPVPFIIYDTQNKVNQRLKLSQNKENGLQKIAGTVLDLMELKKPASDFESLILS
jgi:2,3-bisphosphoglycerate-independent phosphoglycerate mutase